MTFDQMRKALRLNLVLHTGVEGKPFKIDRIQRDFVVVYPLQGKGNSVTIKREHFATWQELGDKAADKVLHNVSYIRAMVAHAEVSGEA